LDVAEETPNQNTPDAVVAPEHSSDCPAMEPSTIDMSLFENLFAGHSVPEHPRDGDRRLLLAVQRGPGVEWGIVWADGRLTGMHSQDAARFVADRYPGCRVACRLVGRWGPESDGV
jgi:hypothetical protein